MPQLAVACDLDGVVSDSFPAFEQWVFKNHRIALSAPIDFDSLPGEIFRFFQLPHLQNFPVRRGARSALRGLKREGWRIFYVTVRHESIRRVTLQWLAEMHLPADAVIFCDPHDSKLTVTSALGGCALVEDEVRHFTSETYADVVRILLATNSPFVRQKNQRTLARLVSPLPHPVLRAPHWSAVYKALQEVAVERGHVSQKSKKSFLQVH